MTVESRDSTTAALTIPELFERAVERSPSSPWLTYEDSDYTYEQAHDRINAMAGALLDRGAKHETPLMVTARNTPEYLFTWLAAMRLGAVVLPVNPESSAAELTDLASQLRPELVITDADLRSLVEKAVADPVPETRVVLVDDLAQATHGDTAIEARPDDVAVMIPTSGTTGRSKLVMQTQGAYAMAGEGFPFWMGLTQADRLMTSLPLFHINAPAYSVLGSIAAGAGLVLLPKFSGSRFIDWSRRYNATEFNAIGAMIEILMRQPERDDDADNPLRLCYTGPSPPKDRQLEVEQRFGLEIVCGYALSETPYGLIWPKGSRPFGSLGRPRQHPTMGEVNRARVMDDGRPAAKGHVGELELKNPAIMLGYYNMPDETEKALIDGWLRTGDLVRVDGDGGFTFVGRKKELIRRRGENLSPVEVELALETHPAVAEAAVVGVPSELSEEEVKAFFVLNDGEAVSPVELRDFVADRLAPFKVPRYFEIVADLPHTPTGRIAKHELPRHRNDAEHDLDTSSSEQRSDSQ